MYLLAGSLKDMILWKVAVDGGRSVNSSRTACQWIAMANHTSFSIGRAARIGSSNGISIPAKARKKACKDIFRPTHCEG